jgi:antitoxin HigA-1
MTSAFDVIGQDGRRLTSAILIHPGEILEDELEARELKKSAFAMDNRIYPSHLSDILKGRRNISAAIALKLEKALGIDAAFWMRLQVDYDLATEREKLELIA